MFSCQTHDFIWAESFLKNEKKIMYILKLFVTSGEISFQRHCGLCSHCPGMSCCVFFFFGRARKFSYCFLSKYPVERFVHNSEVLQISPHGNQEAFPLLCAHTNLRTIIVWTSVRCMESKHFADGY